MKAFEKQDVEYIESQNPFYMPPNPYAPSYASTFTTPDSGLLTSEELTLLHHVNCSYLSSDKPPTLLALKQHAQGLVNLIRKITTSKEAAPIDGETLESRFRFDRNDAFDWLNNLNTPYENTDESHNLLLWGLANIVKEESEDGGIVCHCPLNKIKDEGVHADKDGERRPHMTHQNLVMHANECLEILDHEYGATGGLMSLLPKDDEEDAHQLAGARNTLLGQWLLNHQHLVGRMHELEISYANALDALAGEASVPHQILGAIGPDGMSRGREIVYPQDKYILVNAGEDVTSHIHRLITKAEAQIEQKEKIWKSRGVSGERIWKKYRGGEWYARGIVPVDILTRFYRIKEQGDQSPIFILPAIEQHPGVAHTRAIEKRPTVVSVVTPTWPERVSDWERKFKEKLDEARELELVNQRLVRERLELKDMMAVKNMELKKNAVELGFWEQSVGKEETERHDELLSQVAAHRNTMDELRRQLPSEFHKLLVVDSE